MRGSRDEAPGLFTMLARGARRHCPACGSGGLFSGWFTMKASCPGCDLRFEGPPEEGFFLGAFTINLCLTFGVLLIAVFGFITAMAVGDAPSLVPFLVIAGLGCVLVPVACYPFARTIWVAFELALHNLDDSVSGRRRAGRGHARGAGR